MRLTEFFLFTRSKTTMSLLLLEPQIFPRLLRFRRLDMLMLSRPSAEQLRLQIDTWLETTQKNVKKSVSSLQCQVLGCSWRLCDWLSVCVCETIRQSKANSYRTPLKKIRWGIFLGFIFMANRGALGSLYQVTFFSLSQWLVINIECHHWWLRLSLKKILHCIIQWCGV